MKTTILDLPNFVRVVYSTLPRSKYQFSCISCWPSLRDSSTNSAITVKSSPMCQASWLELLRAFRTLIIPSNSTLKIIINIIDTLKIVADFFGISNFLCVFLPKKIKKNHIRSDFILMTRTFSWFCHPNEWWHGPLSC